MPSCRINIQPLLIPVFNCSSKRLNAAQIISKSTVQTYGYTLVRQKPVHFSLNFIRDFIYIGQI